MSEVAKTTYVRYLLPGAFVPEEEVREISERDPQKAAREAPGSAFAFSFYDRLSASVDHEGRQVTLRGQTINRSGVYYIDAEELSAADVAALPGDHSILLDNMRCNRWETILRCRTGNFQPKESGDSVVSSGKAG